MKNRRKIKDEQNLQFNLTIWKKSFDFDILNYIIEDVTLVQLMDSLVNTNQAIGVVGYWISDSNDKKLLCLTQELLDIICSTSSVKEVVTTFQSVFYAVRHSWAPGNLKEG